MNRAKDFATRYAPDPYTVLLMHMNGENNGTVFTEETGKVVTRIDLPVTSTDYAVFGTSGKFLLPTDKGLTIPHSADFNFGNLNFTIESYVYIPSSTSVWRTIVQHRKAAANSWYFGISSLLKVGFYYSTNGTNELGGTFNTTLNTGAWLHLALVRNGNELALYVNGTKDAATINMTGVTIVDSSVLLGIGIQNDLGPFTNSINGYMDEFRISKGIARWTANFTPPTSPYAR